MIDRMEHQYLVAKKHEENWPTGSVMPHSRYVVGQKGSKEACLAHINQVWTDIRPERLRLREV